MNPLMQNMDRLFFSPCRNGSVRKGDVVVFKAPHDNHLIVHRVVGVDARGVRTQGDNNGHMDPWTLGTDDILGLVKYVVRGKKRIPVRSGVAGRYHAAVMRSYRFLKAGVFHPLRPLYEALLHSGFCKGRMWFEKKLRVISFQRPGGAELQLLMGGRVIGRRRSGASRWEIKRPFDLFVNEDSLPGHPSFK